MDKKRIEQIKAQFDFAIHSDSEADVEFWYAALFNERFIGHNFRTDKPALEIRVNFARRTGSFCSLCYRPCTNLVRPRGQEAD